MGVHGVRFGLAAMLIGFLTACSAERTELAGGPTPSRAPPVESLRAPGPAAPQPQRGGNPIAAFFWALDAAVEQLKEGTSPTAPPATAPERTSVASRPPAETAPTAAREPAPSPVARAAPARSAPKRTQAEHRQGTVAANRPLPASRSRPEEPRAKAKADTPSAADVTSSTRLTNPELAYEEAMLRRDARTMARAARQITGEPATAASIRRLNAQFGIEAEDELVEEIARAAR